MKDLRYIIKRVIIGFLIAILLMMFKSYVYAETNYTQSIDVNINETSTSANRVIYNDSNHNNKAFSNAGRGTLVTMILAYRSSTSTSFILPTVYSVNARTDSGYSTCEVSSVANNSDDNTDDMKAVLYGVKCDLTMGANGLISLSANFAPDNGTSFTVRAYRLTFNNNLEAQEVSYEQYIYQYLQDWIYVRLNGIDQDTTSIDSRLGWIYNYMQQYIYPKMGGIEQSFANGTTQAHTDAQAQTEATNNINSTLNDSDTSNVSLNTLTGNTVDTGAISGIITIPLNLVASVITVFNGTCSPYDFGSLFGTHIIFPCINIESFIGSFLWDTIDIMITGIFIFYISKKFLALFNRLKDLEKIRIGGTDFA